MNKTEFAKRLVRNSRDMCIACIVLPCMAFALGVAAIYFPVPVLTVSIAAAGLGWLAFYRLLSTPEVKDLQGRIATVASFGALSLAHAFGSGMMVAGPGNYDLAAMVLSFGFGLIGALIYRKHQRESAAHELAHGV